MNSVMPPAQSTVVSFCRKIGFQFWTTTTTHILADKSRSTRLNSQTVKRIAVVYSKDRQVFPYI